MCGGAPKTTPQQPPPPAKTAELVIEEPGSPGAKRRKKGSVRIGRSALVTPGLSGLSLGAAAGSAIAGVANQSAGAGKR